MNRVSVDAHTPGLAVIDPRGLGVRAVAYCRADGDEAPQAHITRQVFDAQGRDVAHFDPRFSLDGQVPNLTSIHGLSAVERLTSRADAGWSVVLSGEAGQLLQRWDSRSSQQRSYDGLLRPIAITEQIHDESGRVVERFEYGKPDGGARNQCGQLIRHDDPATTRHMPDFDLHGLPLLETSHFLKSLDPVNWPEELAGRDDLLENGPGLDSQWTYDALGEVATQTDANHNRRRVSLTCAGQLSAVHLQPTGAAEVTLVSDIHYNAGGQVEQERAGNDVITRAMFGPEDTRLERLSAGLPGQPLLQDLLYEYDAVGNPVRIEDQSKTVTYFKNQQVDPVSTYTYDSLYRLIAATGREVFHAANDPNALVNYREEYAYDAGGNTLELRHLGVQSFTRHWAVDESSNRSLVPNEGDPPPDFVQAFDGNGNQRYLLRGQTLSWDTRNQLSEVSPVTRDDGEDDSELYRYGGGGKRLRKVRRSLASGRNLIAEVRYLPGLEIHLTANGEERHVVEVQAGRNSVRLGHWVGNPPVGIDNDYLVYGVSDHLRSSLLELDEQAAVISDEGYRPYGERAWWIAHQGAKASYKTRGYSGKQRDATGLIYYGFRYYAPWLLRWINPDPAGEVDGLNLYCFVRNSPVRYFDGDGRLTEQQKQQAIKDFVEWSLTNPVDPSQVQAIARSLETMAPAPSTSDQSLQTQTPTAPSPEPNSALIQSPVDPFDANYLSLMVQQAVAAIPVPSSGRIPSTAGPFDPRQAATNNSPTVRQAGFEPPAAIARVSHSSPSAYTVVHGKFVEQVPPKMDFVCGKCEKVFLTTAHLRVHLESHAEQKNTIV
ncbi:RHS repeat-associated core domain-containing protein [Pseudomonas sp. S2_E01]